MKLDSLLSYKSAFRLTVLTLIAISSVFALSIVVSYIVFQSKLIELRNSVVVIDRSGEVLTSSLEDQGKNRIYEYQNHVRTFYKTWYQFDEGSYKANIELALELIGDKGSSLLDHYIEQGVERLLVERNLRFEVTINDIQIDMDSHPVKGLIFGEQRIVRKGSMVRRKLDCSFTIYDVDRTQNNPHGAKIGDWDIIDDSIINQ